MNLDEANARYALGKLSSQAMVDLANSWIKDEIYSDSLASLCSISDPIMSDVEPLFAASLKELGESELSRKEAALVLIEASLSRIANGCEKPLNEAEFLYWSVHHELTDELPDQKYLGDNVGLEHVFCWLREIWDCRDGSMILCHTDLSREEAEIKFFEHLKEAADDWLRENAKQGAVE